jgi:hypothetical protein
VDLPLVSLADYEAVIQPWLGLPDRRSRIVVASHAMRRGHPALFGITYRDAFLALGDEPRFGGGAAAWSGAAPFARSKRAKLEIARGKR